MSGPAEVRSQPNDRVLVMVDDQGVSFESIGGRSTRIYALGTCIGDIDQGQLNALIAALERLRRPRRPV